MSFFVEMCVCVCFKMYPQNKSMKEAVFGVQCKCQFSQQLGNQHLKKTSLIPSDSVRDPT